MPLLDLLLPFVMSSLHLQGAYLRDFLAFTLSFRLVGLLLPAIVELVLPQVRTLTLLLILWVLPLLLVLPLLPSPCLVQGLTLAATPTLLSGLLLAKPPRELPQLSLFSLIWMVLVSSISIS